MRICYLANANNIYIHRWTDYFLSRGHEVYIISFEKSCIPNCSTVKSYTLKKINIRIPIVYPILNIFLGLFQLIRVNKLINEIKPDILHAHFVSKYGILALFTRFRPYIVSGWGSDIFVFAKSNFIKKKIVATVLKKAVVVTTTSIYMKDYITKEFSIKASKVVRIPWGIDLKTFHKGYTNEVKRYKKKLNIHKDTPVILSNRNMKPHYRIENIVKAIPIVLNRFPHAIFIFIKGYHIPSYVYEIIQLVQKLKCKNNVHFISEFLSPKQMAVSINSSDILVSIPKADQFASCIMESMACGLIPIVGNLEVYKQYLVDGKNSYFVNPENPREIADKIIYCIEHLELKNKFYKINLKIIKDGEDWEVNAKKMEELYKRIETMDL